VFQSFFFWMWLENSMIRNFNFRVLIVSILLLLDVAGKLGVAV